MRPNEENKLVSSYEIARVIGCSPSCALRLLRKGKFGRVVNLSFDAKRVHHRVRRIDWEAYLVRENYQTELCRSKLA